LKLPIFKTHRDVFSNYGAKPVPIYRLRQICAWNAANNNVRNKKYHYISICYGLGRVFFSAAKQFSEVTPRKYQKLKQFALQICALTHINRSKCYRSAAYMVITCRFLSCYFDNIGRSPVVGCILRHQCQA